MKSKLKNVYYCDYCKKHGLSKVFMSHHENICFKNPDNKRPCFECAHMIKKDAVISGEYFNGTEWEREVSVFFCKGKNIFIYTPVNEFKNNEFDLGDKINEPMPKECDLFTNETLF